MELTDGFHLVIDCPQAQRHRDDLRRAGHSDHRSRPHGAGRGDARLSFRTSRMPATPAAIAGFLTKKPRHLPSPFRRRASQRPHGAGQRHHHLLPDDPHLRLVEREIVDLQQGTTRSWTSSPIAKPLCKAAFRVLHAAISASASPAPSAPRSRPSAAFNLECRRSSVLAGHRCRGRAKSLVKVIVCRPRQAAGPRPIARALDELLRRASAR